MHDSRCSLRSCLLTTIFPAPDRPCPHPAQLYSTTSMKKACACVPISCHVFHKGLHLFRYDLEPVGNMPRVDWDSLQIVETHDIFIITPKRRYLFLVYEMRSHFFHTVICAGDVG